MQFDRSSDMVFTMAEQIAHLSSYITLAPVKSSSWGPREATPPSTGGSLRPGDVVEAWIEGIGALTTHIG
jgi:2-keto-4-pentenoate hydratase/2-oxohepta-3-ene-1,7-dioic acid hydratase in catechol pathway